MQKTIEQYIPRKGDTCYVISGRAWYRNVAEEHPSYGALVRIDKVRINYRRNRVGEVSSARIEVTGIEGYQGGLDLEHYDSDYSRQLLPVRKATPEQVEKFAAARVKRAEQAAKDEQKKRDAARHEKDFIAAHQAEINAPVVYGEVTATQRGDRHIFASVRTYKRFIGGGFTINIEEREEEVSVTLRWEEEMDFRTDTVKGRWVFDFTGGWNTRPEAMDAYIRCAVAAQAKLAELQAASAVEVAA